VNVTDYLERIDYHGPVAPTAETLRELQAAHLLTVPFENLSIHARQPIVLDDLALFEKIVRKRRGGFCYEANGLFAALLRTLGFNVKMLSAGVANAEGFGPEFDHMTLMITIDERWLVDVGFGDSFREPLLIDNNAEQRQGDRIYLINPDGSYLILMQREDRTGSNWKAQYRFTLQPYEYSDYEEMCRYHQTSPLSSFTRERICSRATPDGRVTLSEMRLIITRNGDRQERVLTNEEEYAEILREHFGISLLADGHAAVS
jgi:N-hydroxyarylamine O-acetyltransferase